MPNVSVILAPDVRLFVMSLKAYHLCQMKKKIEKNYLSERESICMGEPLFWGYFTVSKQQKTSSCLEICMTRTYKTRFKMSTQNHSSWHRARPSQPFSPDFYGTISSFLQQHHTLARKGHNFTFSC